MEANDYSAGSTSLSLLARVRQNDAEAWTRLSRIYGPLIYAWARGCRLSPEDSGDVVQETFIILTRKIASFRRDRPGDTFRGWLWTVTRNLIRDHIRRLSDVAVASGGTTHRLLLQEVAEDAPEPLDETDQSKATDAEMLRAILAVVRNDFTPNAWQAFWLLSTQDRTAVEIARELGITKSAVYQAKYRILKRIREELDDFGLIVKS